MSVYSDIKSAISTHISAVTGVQVSYGYEKGLLEGYPASILTLESVDSEYESTYQNSRKYAFKLKILQEMSEDGAGAEEAESRIEALIDTILEKFEDDYTLGGLCHKVTIKAITGYVDRGSATRVFEATIECSALITL